VGRSSAQVIFIDADDCQKYLDATANGIEYDLPSARGEVAFVDPGRDVDVVGGRLRDMLQNGVTRCVQAIGVDKNLSSIEIAAFPKSKALGIEGIRDTVSAKGYRTVCWRFCEIREALTFKTQLDRDEDCEHWNVKFVPDP